jgi:hypothetical protein
MQAPRPSQSNREDDILRRAKLPARESERALLRNVDSLSAGRETPCFYVTRFHTATGSRPYP